MSNDGPIKLILVVFERLKGSHKGRRHIAPYLTQEELDAEKRILELDSEPFQKIIAEGVTREEALALCKQGRSNDLCLIHKRRKKKRVIKRPRKK